MKYNRLDSTDRLIILQLAENYVKEDVDVLGVADRMASWLDQHYHDFVNVRDLLVMASEWGETVEECLVVADSYLNWVLENEEYRYTKVVF